MKLDVHLGNGTIQTLAERSLGPTNFITVPDDGYKYWQVRHDFQTNKSAARWHGVPRSIDKQFHPGWPDNKRSLPEIVLLKGVSSGDFTPMSFNLQVLWFRMIEEESGNLHSGVAMRQIWRDVTAQARALTDRHSREYGFADYVLGEYLDGKPMAIMYGTCGGSLVRQIGTQSGNYNIVIEAINTKKPLLTAREYMDEKPWLVQWATESTVMKRTDGSYTVSRWHWNFYEGIKFGTPFPLLSGNGKFGIERANVLPLIPGQTISPYNPPTA